VILVVNKVDNPELEAQAWEFFRLGVGEPFPISALHGRSTGDLLDRVLEIIGGGAGEEEEEPVRVAVIGRPNVGKSSLVNRLLGAERVIVSEVPGTTRDTVDVEFVYQGQKFVLVDTAGIRRRSRIDSATEFYSVRRALRAIERAQVVVLVIEAPLGVTAQDKRLAARVAEAYKALVVVVNKWDLLDEAARRAYPAFLAHELAFVAWAPRLFVSALTGRRVPEIMAKVRAVFAAAGRRLPTAEVNRFFTEVVTLTPPPQLAPKPAKLYYATQVGVYPPTFVLFVARSRCFTPAYLRHLEGRLREAYDFEGTPLRLLIREKGAD
jgi:GTP-binding protein